MELATEWFNRMTPLDGECAQSEETTTGSLV